MSAEDKFEVDLGFNVKEASGEAFCEGHLKYNSLPYQGLVTLEQLLLDALVKLHVTGASDVLGEEQFKEAVKKIKDHGKRKQRD
jgi:hypothetical protein|tara:strand:+ start:964 stop:1215 length:252 start_codon:yes stop_codon:yes gene_type:complete